MAKEPTNNSFVAAIVLGSTKMTGIVGRKEPEGKITVLAYTAVASTDFLTKGRVYNGEKMTACLKSIRETLEEKTNRNISRMYVALDCMGIRSVAYTVEKNYTQRETVTTELINSILSSKKEEEQRAERVILETLPLEYRLGSITTTEPIGVMADSIKAKFLNIVCSRTAVETIEACFAKAGITIARQTVAATQLASIVTTEQERNAGCVFVDMGSETTSVAIYKGKALRHLAVIPLGGANITRDIANVFNCDETEAEKLKLSFGYPNFEELEADGGELIHLRDGGRARTQRELAEIIDARVEEIVQNIKHQVEASGFNSENLVNGIYIIGGAAQLSDIIACFEQHFKGWNLRILKTPPRLTLDGVDRNFNEAGHYNVGLALIENGDLNCNDGERTVAQADLFEQEAAVEEETSAETPPIEEPLIEEVPTPAKPKGPSTVTRLKNWLKSMVTEED